MSALMSAHEICKGFSQGETRVTALNRVDLSLDEGEMLAICGHSGSGKSTLLNVIGTLEIPDSGELHLWGNSVNYERIRQGSRKGQLTSAAELSHQQLRQQGMGFVFQNYNLNPALTALENVSLPLLLTADAPKIIREKAQRRLEDVGLGDRLHHKPGELSGGQQQRVAVARALVTDPKLVLADEPTANLDNASTERLIEVMRQLNHQQGTSFLFSTHDERLTCRVDRQLWLDDGSVKSPSQSS